METNKKTALGLGSALAALFVGASLCAAPASALATGAHANQRSAPLFAHRDRDDQNRDGNYDTRHDKGNHYGSSKQNKQQTKEHQKWLREQAKRYRKNGGSQYGNGGGQYYRRDGDNDRDDNNNTQYGGGYHRGQDHNWNGTHNGSSTWGRNQGGQNLPPPPPNYDSRTRRNRR